MTASVVVTVMVVVAGVAVKVTDVVDGVTPRQEQALDMREDGTPERQQGDGRGCRAPLLWQAGSCRVFLAVG